MLDKTLGCKDYDAFYNVFLISFIADYKYTNRIKIVSNLDFLTFPEFLKKLLRYRNRSKPGFFCFPGIPQKTVATSKSFQTWIFLLSLDGTNSEEKPK